MIARKTGYNSRLPQWGLECLIEASCFHQSLCLIQSESLRNRHLWVAVNRYLQP